MFLYSEYEAAKAAHVASNVRGVFENFTNYLDRRVDELNATDLGVSWDLRYLSQRPSPRVREYNAIWAYGNHFRAVNPITGNPYESYDSGVASIQAQTCQSSSRDRNPVNANLNYVGVLQKVLRVEYASLKVNVMKCNWIKPNLVGQATMRLDEHGFWLVKHGAFQPHSAEPYVLPAHVSQV